MATFTYDEKTNREDLSDVVVNISPTDTPLTTMFGKTKSNGHYHEWVEDTLRKPKDNAQIEGADYTAKEVGSRQRLGNYTQTFEEDFKVTETQQAVNTAGVSDEFGYAQINAMKALAQDVEYALTMSKTKDIGDKTKAPRMAGVQGIVTTNILKATKLDGNAIADAQQMAYLEGGNPSVILASPKNKRLITSMVTSNTRNINAKDKSIVEAVNVFESDFGPVEVKMSRIIGDDKVFLLSPKYFKLAWLRGFKKVDLPKTGDSRAAFISGELTLEGKAEKASAIIDLSGAAKA